MLVPIVGSPVRALPPSATIATSARSRSAWPIDQVGQVLGRALLLALDDDLDRARQVARRRAARGAPPRGSRSRTCRRPRRGRTATVAHHGLERRRSPQSRGRRGLHVVVGVEQDRRRAGGPGRSGRTPRVGPRRARGGARRSRRRRAGGRAVSAALLADVRPARSRRSPTEGIATSARQLVDRSAACRRRWRRGACRCPWRGSLAGRCAPPTGRGARSASRRRRVARVPEPIVQPEAPGPARTRSCSGTGGSRPRTAAAARRRRRSARSPSRQPALELASIGQRARSGGDAHAPICASRGRRREVGVGRIVARHRVTRPRDADLAVELAPEDGEGARAGSRRGGGPCGCRGSCRRRTRSGSTPRSSTWRTDGRAVGVGGGERDRVGQGDAGGLGVGEPASGTARSGREQVVALERGGRGCRSVPASSRIGHGRIVRASRPVCPRQDSNLRTRLRRPVLYPLSYGGEAPSLTDPPLRSPVAGTSPVCSGHAARAARRRRPRDPAPARGELPARGVRDGRGRPGRGGDRRGDRARAPDAVVLDVMLPGMDGHEVVARLRDEPATRRRAGRVPHARAAERRPAVRSARTSPYVRKPFDPSELVATRAGRHRRRA